MKHHDSGKTHLPELDDYRLLLEVVLLPSRDFDRVRTQDGLHIGGVDRDLCITTPTINSCPTRWEQLLEGGVA